MKAFFVLFVIFLISVAGISFAVHAIVASLSIGVLPPGRPLTQCVWYDILFWVCYAGAWSSLAGMACLVLRGVSRIVLPESLRRRAWPTIMKYGGISTTAATGRRHFGIVTLLWVTLLASILLSAYSVKRKSMRAQEAALTSLGHFVQDSEWVFGNVDSLYLGDGNHEIDDSVIPKLAPFRKLKRLSLRGRGITGDRLSELPCKKLEWLSMGRTSVTDAGLPHLLSLTRLECLCLYNTNVTDEGLRILAKHPNLRKLDLSSTRITDDGLKHWKAHNSLERLSARSTAITDEGLRELANLKLTSLDLNDALVTGEGFGELQGLISLDLTNTRTNDAGLRKIGLQKNLEFLILSGTDISDSGLEHLHGLRHLWALDITNTKVSPAAVEKLRRALPSCVQLSAPPVPVGQASQKPSVEVGGAADSPE